MPWLAPSFVALQVANRIQACTFKTPEDHDLRASLRFAFSAFGSGVPAAVLATMADANDRIEKDSDGRSHMSCASELSFEIFQG